MFRIVFKSLAICLVIFGVVVYAAYLQTGRLWLPSVSMPNISLPSWAASSPKMEALEAPSKPTWRWRQNGRWHYGDNPPLGVKAQRIDRQSSSELVSPSP